MKIWALVIVTWVILKEQSSIMSVISTLQQKSETKLEKDALIPISAFRIVIFVIMKKLGTTTNYIFTSPKRLKTNQEKGPPMAIWEPSIRIWVNLRTQKNFSKSNSRLLNLWEIDMKKLVHILI